MARRAACASLRLLLLFALFAPFALWDSFRSGPRYIGFVSNRFQVLPVSRRLLLATACFPLPAAAESRPATKAELYEIAGAFAKLASTPNGPGAAEVYEEVETTLGNAIQKWESGTISAKAIVEERARLRLGRARARVVYNDLLQGTRPDKVAGAIQDYDVGISIMEVDFREHPDRVMYSEYPDALVKRGLAKEGLQDWNGAVQDYTKAIQALRPKDGRADVAMPGNSRIQEGDGLGMNPLILNFRGNVLGQLRRYDEAVEDYEEATQIFDADGEVRQASLSRANTGLALFGAGREAEAQLIMEKVVRNDPGVTDAHVALAAWYWANGRVPEAESQWQFACEQIDSGCQAYKDMKWVTEVRRWPPSLANGDFRAYTILPAGHVLWQMKWMTRFHGPGASGSQVGSLVPNRRPFSAPETMRYISIADGVGLCEVTGLAVWDLSVGSAFLACVLFLMFHHVSPTFESGASRAHLH